jgi:N-acetylmuramoyl-L-alanine amidase
MFKKIMNIIVLMFIITLTSAHAKTGQEKWHLTLDLSKKPEFRSFMLSNPRRLVVDIHNARLLTHIRQSQYRNSPVSHIRWSEKASGVRLVLDLKHAVKIHVSATDFADTGRPQLRIDLGQKIGGNDAPVPTAEMTAPSPRHIITSETTPHNKRNIIIVIDPGHGGKDPGATGRAGTREKNVVLAISKKLCDMINSEPGFTAKLTRDSDYYITLRQRLTIARHYHADMFIAIHADKWKNSTAKGASVYALSLRGATGEAARWLAARENESELMGGLTLNDKSQVLKSVLINLSQSAAINSSLQVGDDIIAALRQVTPMHVNHVEQAAFVVLKSPDIPSLLVETGFLSNPREETELLSAAYQHRLATAIYAGLIRYYHQHPPRDSMLSPQGK